MKKITDISQLDPNGVYTYADYLTWQFEQTVELVKGKLLKMVKPNRKHQEISFQLNGLFYNVFKGLRYYAYAASFDVRLFDRKKSMKANKDVLTVVQPDLCVICDREKLDEKGCIGAPDLIIEILSASNSKKEMRTKKELCEENSVKEYWIIDPTHETLLQYSLQDDGIYTPPFILVNDETVQSSVFPTLQIDLSELFESEEE